MSHLSPLATGSVTTGWSDVLWLVRREMRRTWRSYLASAVYMAFMSVFFAVATVNEQSDYMIDFLFVVVTSVLATNFMRADYFRYSDDPFGPNVAFLRSLPISTATIVRSRLLLMLAAWVLNIPAFFLPWWYLGDPALDAGEFIAFALFWIGLSAIGACIASYFEFASTVKRYTIAMVAVAVAMVAGMAALHYWTDLAIVSWAMDRARDSGPLLALAGLAIGAGALVIADRGLRAVVLNRDPAS
jgi:hypothetical protein